MRAISIRPISFIVALWGLLLAGCIQSGSPTAEFAPIAAETTTTLDKPLETQPNFYYYVDGDRILLTPSLEWVSVRFVSAEPGERESVLLPYASQLGRVEDVRELPAPALTLLPLRKGASLQNLLDLLQAMRSDSDSIVFANPLFETADVWMTFDDQFIAGFSAETTRAGIDGLNAQYDVEVVDTISGQDNVFVLRVSSGSGLDALTAANLYQESGIVIHAAPDFIRITK